MKKLWLVPLAALVALVVGCQSDNANPDSAPAPGTPADTAAASKGGEAASGPEPTPGPGISGAESRVGSQIGG